MPKGEHSKSLGMAMHYNEEDSRLVNGSVAHESFNPNNATIDFCYRKGMGRDLDIGVRWGSGGLGIDVKRSMINSQKPWIPRLALDLDFLVNNGIFIGQDFEGGVAVSCITDRKVRRNLGLINSLSLKYYMMNFPPNTQLSEEGKSMVRDMTGSVSNVVEKSIILELPVGLQFFGKNENRSFLVGVIPQVYLYRKTKEITIETDYFLDILEYSHKYDVQFILQYSFF
ncbi:MAG TPA: hypothetical protein VGB16_04990 [candidate division Zixibacteria bacterium]